MSYTNSYTWRSENAIQHRAWKKADSDIRKIRFDRSPFVPKTFEEYLEHQAEYNEMKTNESKEKLYQYETDREVKQRLGIDKWPMPAVWGGKMFCDGRRGVLGHQTVWAHLWTPHPEHPLASWPGPDEQREEGDERNTSGFGRFLPIPRVPGNPTVVWKQKGFLTQYPFDRVKPVPKHHWCPVPLPGDYEVREPVCDGSGAVVDDPSLPGRTAGARRCEPFSGRRRRVSTFAGKS